MTQPAVTSMTEEGVTHVYRDLATVSELIICSTLQSCLCLSRPSNIIFQSKDLVHYSLNCEGFATPTYTHIFLLPPHAHKYCDRNLAGATCLFAVNVYLGG